MARISKERSLALKKHIDEEFPEVKIAYRRGVRKSKYPWDVRLFIWMMNTLAFFFSYLKNYSQVYGNWIILPDSKTHGFLWSTMSFRVYRILVHELEHVRQSQDNILWKLRYLLSPIPILITERGKWEKQAYMKSMEADYLMYGFISDDMIDSYVSYFTGYKYLWMDVRKKKVRREFETKADFIMSEGRVSLP